MIKINNLTKTYFDENNNNYHALNNISLEIEDGDIFGIIGMSGAGKTTLIRCLSHLEQPDSGAIFIGETNIADVNNKKLKSVFKKMGVVFQGYNLLEQENIYDNIAFPLKINNIKEDAIKKRVHELLNLVNLADKEKSYPSKLSGGQKQRVAIARALASSPEILLCDEPTSALDPLTTKSILDLLLKINEKYKTTIVIITHEIRLIKMICDKVAVISAGKIVENGAVEDVFLNPRNDITKMLIKEGL
ncbi:MAG: methionine ABC transporter ATP-binding protein [Bacilli bacterium]|nr:methionine ABC transporter ATP-binding protein [Bacilli bacterium]